jgi:hypothetical protein
MKALMHGGNMGYQQQKERFFLALRSGNFRTVRKMLVDSPMVAVGKIAREKSTLHVAAELGDRQMISALLEAHPMLAREKDVDGRTASAYAKDEDIRQLLIDAEILDWQNRGGEKANPTRARSRS